MLLSERWMRKVQEYELQIQMKRLKIKAKRLEHNLSKLSREHEEEKKAAYDQSVKLSSYFTQNANSYHDVMLETSPTLIPMDRMRSVKWFLIFPNMSKSLKILGGGLLDASSNPEVTSCPDLFEESTCEVTGFKLIGEPIFDSYEQEGEELSSLDLFSSDVCAENEAMAEDTPRQHAHLQVQPQESSRTALIFDEVPPKFYVAPQRELRDLHSKADVWELLTEISSSNLNVEGALLIEEAESSAEHPNSGMSTLGLNLNSFETPQLGLKEVCSLVSPTIHDQAMLWDSFVAPMSTISSVNSSGQSSENSFKNCYVFKRKGLHSVLKIKVEVKYEPGVQDQERESRLKNCYTFKRKGVLSVLFLTGQIVSQSEVQAKVVPCVYDIGLCDFHKKDNESGVLLSPTANHTLNQPYELS